MGHVPLAFHLSFLLQRPQEGVDGAGSEVDSEASAYFGYYLVAVHGLVSEEL